MTGLENNVRYQIEYQDQFDRKLVTREMVEYGLKRGFIRCTSAPQKAGDFQNMFCLECLSRDGKAPLRVLLPLNLLVHNNLIQIAVMVMNSRSEAGTPNDWFERIREFINGK